MMFGRAKQKSFGKASGAPSGPGDGEPPANAFPWAGDESEIACNLATGAYGSFVHNAVTAGGRVHAETFCAVVGALAGYAAQRSFLDLPGNPQLQVATTNDGRRFLYSEELNRMVVHLDGDQDLAACRVWNRAAGAAISAGLGAENLPQLQSMFAHVAGHIGDQDRGMPSVDAKHRPHLSADEIVSRFWPTAERILKADIDSDIHRKFGPVPARWWVAITAVVAGNAVMEVKEVLSPDVAVTIVTESAIYASKILPPA